MARHGKKYRAAAERVTPDTFYMPLEAAQLLKEISFANFDETVEVHYRAGIDADKLTKTSARRSFSHTAPAR